jgi:hypothetical protein
VTSRNKTRASASIVRTRPGRARTWGAAAVLVGLTTTSGPAVAQEGLRLDPVVSYQVAVKTLDGRLVADIRGAPKNPRDIEPPWVATAVIRMSPKLCEARYRVAFVFTTITGRIREIPYALRLRRGRLDGVARRCPLADLPRRDLTSIHMRFTLDGNLLMRFVARPVARPRSPFAPLQADVNFYGSTTLGGQVGMRFSARYRFHRSYTAEWVVEAGVRH